MPAIERGAGLFARGAQGDFHRQRAGAVDVARGAGEDLLAAALGVNPARHAVVGTADERAAVRWTEHEYHWLMGAAHRLRRRMRRRR